MPNVFRERRLLVHPRLHVGLAFPVPGCLAATDLHLSQWSTSWLSHLSHKLTSHKGDGRGARALPFGLPMPASVSSSPSPLRRACALCAPLTTTPTKCRCVHLQGRGFREAHVEPSYLWRQQQRRCKAHQTCPPIGSR